MTDIPETITKVFTRYDGIFTTLHLPVFDSLEARPRQDDSILDAFLTHDVSYHIVAITPGLEGVRFCRYKKTTAEDRARGWR